MCYGWILKDYISGDLYIRFEHNCFCHKNDWWKTPNHLEICHCKRAKWHIYHSKTVLNHCATTKHPSLDASQLFLSLKIFLTLPEKTPNSFCHCKRAKNHIYHSKTAFILPQTQCSCTKRQMTSSCSIVLKLTSPIATKLRLALKNSFSLISQQPLVRLTSRLVRFLRRTKIHNHAKWHTPTCPRF